MVLMGNKFYNKAKKIDKILSYEKPSLFIKMQLLMFIISDKSCENYFFERVQNINFFNFLRLFRYFSASKALKPMKSQTDKAYFTIPTWNILLYLEKISEQIKGGKNKEYRNDLLYIIDAVTKYHVKHKRPLDNYRTWSCFIRILINLPNASIVKFIQQHYIDIVQDWIK